MQNILKISLFCLFVYALSLHSIPIPLYSFPDAAQSNSTESISSFTMVNNQIFALDKDKKSLFTYNPSTKEKKMLLTDKVLLAKPIDITTDDKYLYILEASKRQVITLDLTGKVLRSFSTEGSLECEFRDPVRILVNFQGVLYVLDTSRKQILSFTNEGLFIKSYNCEFSVSMTLGLDQNLRLLTLYGERYQIDYVTPDLVFTSSLTLQGIEAGKGELVDIAINEYYETYIINSSKCQISKIDESGKVILKSGFGSKAKKASVGAFSEPAMVKLSSLKGIPTLAILDTKLQNIQFFEDREFEPAKRMQKPEWSMRVALLDSEMPPFVDFLAVDSLHYFIREYTDTSGMFANVYRNLTCEGPKSKVFELKALDDKKKKQFFLDYMTVIGDSLYVTDSQNHNVNVWHSKTGRKLFSFGTKGSGNGQLKSPLGIAHDKDLNIYVCDKDNNRIAVFSRYGIFMRNIDKLDAIVSPTQIYYTTNNKLIVLCNQKTIVEVDPVDYKASILLTREKITGIEFSINDWLTVVDELTQNVLLFDGKKEVLRFGAANTKAGKQYFGLINAMRYNQAERVLYLSDSVTQTTKCIKFYLPPQTPQNLKLVPAVTKDVASPTQTTIHTDGQQAAKLVWDTDSSSHRWIVYAYTASDTSYNSTDTNQLVLSNPQPHPIRYSVVAASEDGRLSQFTPMLTDDFSYARYLENTGNHLQAIEVYQKFNEYNKSFAITPAICRNYYAIAQSSMQQRDYDNALVYYKLARQYSAQPDSIITQIIKVYKQNSAWQTGMEFLLTLDSNAFVKGEMLSLLYLSEDYTGTVQCAEDLIKTGNENLRTLEYLANAKEKLHLYSDALDTYRKVVKLSSAVPDQIKVAEMLIKLANYEEAIIYLQKVYTQAPPSHTAEIQYMLGLAYLGSKLYPRASDSFNEALRLDSTQSEYYYYLGYSYLWDRKYTEATQNLKKAYQLQPDSFVYGIELAQLYEKETKLSEALDVLDNIRSYVPTDSSATRFHLFYGNILLQKKRYDDAYRELLTASKLLPTDQAILAKLNEVIAARTQYNQDREPLEIKQTVFDPVYPSLLEYYKTHPIGEVTLFNTRNVPINDIKLTVSIADVTLKSMEKTIPSVLAGQELLVDIYQEFSPSMLTKCELSALDFLASVSVEYTWESQPKKLTEMKTVSALRIQAMDWKNRKQLASFVNPSDENLRSYGLGITNTMKVPASTELPKKVTQAMQYYSWLTAKGMRYISDPAANDAVNTSTDYVQFPYQTLQNNGGDCDDLVVLLSSILACTGVSTAFIDLPGHVVPAFDTGMKIEDIEKQGFDRSDFIIRGNVIWMPLEMTLIGKENFYRSWKSAIMTYKQTIESGVIPDFFVFSDAHQTYPPVAYLKPIAQDSDALAIQALALYKLDAENMANAGLLAIEEENIKTLKLYPDNLGYRNRFALWYVENGKMDKARALWVDILKAQPNHYSTLINLGNLELMDKNYDAAKDYYLRAMTANLSQKDKVLRNLCILEYRAGNISAARDYFKQIQDSSTLRRLNPQIYQELLQ